MKLMKLNFSASAIANKNRYLYDIFALPTSFEAYIPNERVKNLLIQYNSEFNDDDLNMIELKLRYFKSLHTWTYSSGGSETNINGPLLSSYMSTIHSFKNLQPINSKVSETIPFDTFLASRSHPEPFIEWNNHILIASEAKGIESSQYPALVQGFQIGGDGAIELRRSLSLRDSVVPVILCFGTFLQIFAVYLLPENFPVMIELSEPISYLTRTGRLSLARWVVVLNSFYLKTITLLSSPSLKKNNNLNQNGVYLSQQLFYKPILNNFNTGDPTINNGSCLRSCVELVMLAYKRLSEVEESNNYFLFPIGLMSYPANQFSDTFFNGVKLGLFNFFEKFFPHKQNYVEDGCPIIVFDLLNTEWKNTKPPQEFYRLYLDAVEKAVLILNSAEIAHLDLRPTNIMWRIQDTTLEIKVIDFEDSLPFNTIFEPYEAILYDRRYPFFGQNTYHKITKIHNSWFLVAINRWIESEVDRFEDFMNNIECYQMVENEWKLFAMSSIDEGKSHK